MKFIDDTSLVFGIAFLVLVLFTAPPVEACHDGSPLILDLDGDGVISTTDGRRQPVAFDIDDDGEAETVGWTAPDYEDAFLWLDLNHNRQVDSGRELFGDFTRLPTGERAENGFEALAVYDLPEHGGNADGIISYGDLAYAHLRLWVDRSHDGIAQKGEVYTLAQRRVTEIHLRHESWGQRDGTGARMALRGTYVMQTGGLAKYRIFDVVDVFFPIIHADDDH